MHGDALDGTPPGVRVSSGATPILKFVWPAGWLGLIGCFNVLAFTDSPGLRWGGGVDPAWGKALLAALLALGVYVVFRVSAPLKRVHLVPGGLRVSSYFRETRVPWMDVERVVVHGRFERRRRPLVELKLRRRGAFGTRISLLPASPQALEMLQANADARAGISSGRRSQAAATADAASEQPATAAAHPLPTTRSSRAPPGRLRVRGSW